MQGISFSTRILGKSSVYLFESSLALWIYDLPIEIDEGVYRSNWFSKQWKGKTQFVMRKNLKDRIFKKNPKESPQKKFWKEIPNGFQRELPKNDPKE